MEINRRSSHRGLPDDDPTFAGLVADLKVLHQVSPPNELYLRLAGGPKQQPPKAEGLLPFPSRKRADALPIGRTRRMLTQGIAAALFIAVLALASGALTFSVRQATTRRSVVGAGSPTSGIPKGAKIKLTIDSYVQTHIVEPTLANLIRQYKAASGTIVVERPSDGAIIAMDSQPNPDSRTWQQVAASNAFGTFPNPASNVAFTPGQIIQTLLAGIGFDTGSFDEQTVVNNAGPFKTDGVIIQDWCLDTCGYGGSETVTDMLHYASNIAAVLLVNLIPMQEFFQYLDNFGLGRATAGPGLPNANSGTMIEPFTTVNGKKVPNPSWRPAYRDLTAFGQGVPSTPPPPGQPTVGSTSAGMVLRQVITATPLQIANNYAALANGGKLMQPYLVKSYSLDGRTTVIQPRVLNSVFQQADTAQRVTNVLVQSDINGEACEALVPGYDVAAKTGTSGMYLDGTIMKHSIAGAVAYGPIGEMDPARRVVVLIELKDPNTRWASETAAPGVSKILRRIFLHYGLRPDPKSTQPTQVCLRPNSPA